MLRTINNYKREMFYSIILFVVFEMMVIPQVIGLGWLFIIFAMIGFSLLATWMVSNYSNFGGKVISEHSEVLLWIDLKRRFFAYFFTPTIFYIAICLYLYSSVNMMLKQLLLLVASITMYILLINIRSSYRRVFSVEVGTRIAYQFVDLVLFYVGVSGFVLIGTNSQQRIAGTVVVGSFLLLHQLILNKQLNRNGTYILLASIGTLLLSALYFVNYSAISYPLYMSTVFYTIVSVWGIRLSGERRLGEFIRPVLFSLMALMILLSF